MKTMQIGIAVLATGLTLGVFAQEPHAASSTTPDTPASVTQNKDAQQASANSQNDQKSLKRKEKADRAQARYDKAQRKAMKAQEKANREAEKAK